MVSAGRRENTRTITMATTCCLTPIKIWLPPVSSILRRRRLLLQRGCQSTKEHETPRIFEGELRAGELANKGLKDLLNEHEKTIQWIFGGLLRVIPFAGKRVSIQHPAVVETSRSTTRWCHRHP